MFRSLQYLLYFVAFFFTTTVNSFKQPYSRTHPTPPSPSQPHYYLYHHHYDHHHLRLRCADARTDDQTQADLEEAYMAGRERAAFVDCVDAGKVVVKHLSHLSHLYIHI